MPEERGLYPKMKVLDRLIYLARLHGLAPRDLDRGDRRPRADRDAGVRARDASDREGRIRSVLRSDAV